MAYPSTRYLPGYFLGELRALHVGRSSGARKPRWRITAEALEAFELVPAARTPTPSVPRARRRKRPADFIEFLLRISVGPQHRAL